MHPQETLSSSSPLPRRRGSAFGGHRLQDLPEPPDSGRDRARRGDGRDATPPRILRGRSACDVAARIDRGLRGQRAAEPLRDEPVDHVEIVGAYELATLPAE